MGENSLRIILVHGLGHGGWCWHKVVAGLESKGYLVTAVDLAASGADPLTIPEDVSTFAQYSKPLMDLVAAAPVGEKLLLVGHSLGGVNISFAMDAFPQKVAAGVFITAIMPDTVHKPDYLLNLYIEKLGHNLRDAEIRTVAVPGSSQEIALLKMSEKMLATNMYQNCNFEDLTMAKLRVRFGSLFVEDLKKIAPLSQKGYGTIDKVYVVCDDDNTLNNDFQHFIIQNYEVNSGIVKEVIEIKGADHMVMFSKSQNLCEHLGYIADKYL